MSRPGTEATQALKPPGTEARKPEITRSHMSRPGTAALTASHLHTGGVLGLGQDLEQLVVGQDVEAREGEALGLQVVVQPLLHLLQQLVGLRGGAFVRWTQMGTVGKG